MKRSPVLFALLLVAMTDAAGQGTSALKGRVVNEAGEPVASATITITNIGYSVRSDSSGSFSLSGTPGSTLNLRLRAEGYRDDSATVVFSRGKSLTIDFKLKPATSLAAESNPSDLMLRGRVVDPEGGWLSYANVQVNGGSRIVADDSGRFIVPMSGSGRLTLLVRRIGFEPAEVRFAEMPDTAVRITLKPVAVTLPEQRVVGRAAFVSLDLSGFYRRMGEKERGINRGYFVTPEELDFRKPIMVTAAIEQFPHIRIRPIPGSKFPLNRTMRIEDTRGCPLTVYLDRILIQPTTRRGEVVDEEINTLIQPTTLAGIEVYSRAMTVPPEFPMHGGTCGVVLIWTK